VPEPEADIDEVAGEMDSHPEVSSLGEVNNALSSRYRLQATLDYLALPG